MAPVPGDFKELIKLYSWAEPFKNWFFTGDQHYGHSNIINFLHRPFSDVEDMDKFMIDNFNSKVPKQGTTIHAGDFSFYRRPETKKIIAQLNGNHVFLYGCHDQWMKQSDRSRQIFRKNIFIQFCPSPFVF